MYFIIFPWSSILLFSYNKEMTFAIEKEFFNKLNTLVNTSQIEHCGNLISDGYCFHLAGPIWKGEARSCQYEEKLDEFFHTHPSSVRSYPSYEDIESIVKKRKLSVIATFWGIWFIYKNGNQVDCHDIHDIGYIFNSRYEAYNILFSDRATNGIGSIPRSIPYNRDVEDMINRFIAVMNDTLRRYCTLKFVAWGDVATDDVLAYFRFRSRTKKSTRKSSKKTKRKSSKKSTRKASKKSTRKASKKRTRK